MNKKTWISILSLSLATMFMGALIVLTHQWTAPIIESRLNAGQNDSLFAVLPDADDFLSNSFEWNGQEIFYSRATNGAGLVFFVTGQGFGGPLEMLVGVNFEGLVTGVLVTDHNETPGLGSPGTEATFLSQFAGNILEGFTVVESVSNEQEIEILSGATVTAEGIVGTVNQIAYLFALAEAGQATGGTQ